MWRKLNCEEVKKIQIEILDIFVSFCEKHHKHYWIDRGTLIGAIRHNGYIPWDDDIDTGMLREDFDYLVRNFNKENCRYQCYCVDNTPDFPFAFAKIVDTDTMLIEKGYKTCINIDVFPYDDAPDGKSRIKCMYIIRDILLDLSTLRTQTVRPNGSFFRRLIVYCGRFFAGLFHQGRFAAIISKRARKYNNRGYSTIGNFTTITEIRCSKELTSLFGKVIFEGKSYDSLRGYDEWLTELYGNYMELPPIEKRVSHHFFEAYLKC